MDTATVVVSPQKMTLIAPRIGALWPEQGGIYAGIVGGEKGQPDYHLIHAASEHEIFDTNWNDAIEAAKASINGFSDWSLPDRREARLLSINSPDSFDKDDWYWTSTQHAGDSDYAWNQDFSHGGQDLIHKSCEARARAVRRVSII
jgi:hypothetical protein